MNSKKGYRILFFSCSIIRNCSYTEYQHGCGHEAARPSTIGNHTCADILYKNMTASVILLKYDHYTNKKIILSN